MFIWKGGKKSKSVLYTELQHPRLIRIDPNFEILWAAASQLAGNIAQKHSLPGLIFTFFILLKTLCLGWVSSHRKQMKHLSTPGHLTATGIAGNWWNYNVWKCGNGTGMWDRVQWWMWWGLSWWVDPESLIRDLRPFSLPPQMSLSLWDIIHTPQHSQYWDTTIKKTSFSIHEGTSVMPHRPSSCSQGKGAVTWSHSRL